LFVPILLMQQCTVHVFIMEVDITCSDQSNY
jgi:hypothetical protein